MCCFRSKRFGEGWETLSPDIAAHILSLGYWRELPSAAALLERHPGDLRASLLVCADAWLERLSGGVRYGGNGAIIVYLGLQRSGGASERYRVLMEVSSYSPPDVELIQEAILALPMAERERIALKNPPISRLYSPCVPTTAIIERAIAEILTWKKKPSIYPVHDATRIIFPAWGATSRGRFWRCRSMRARRIVGWVQRWRSVSFPPHQPSRRWRRCGWRRRVPLT